MNAKTVYYIIWCRVINPNAKNLSAPFHVSVVVNFTTNIQKHFWFGAVPRSFSFSHSIIFLLWWRQNKADKWEIGKFEQWKTQFSNIEWTCSSDSNNNDKCSNFCVQNKSPCGECIIYYANKNHNMMTTNYNTRRRTKIDNSRRKK